jgi:prepilin-type N-terminal cleavage/methylation domain-containing protein
MTRLRHSLERTKVSRAPQARLAAAARTGSGRKRRAFTLIELLVVILIILAVSAVALPTVLPAFNHRQVSEAARILQAGLAGARDTAINTGSPAGIRLLPDPTLMSTNTTTTGNEIAFQIDPTKILASNRFIPIQFAPDYSEGFVSIRNNPPGTGFTATFPYQSLPSGQFYPVKTSGTMLYLIENTYDSNGNLNPPTSWYWNIRVGDKVQVNSTGTNYTVIGPMTTPNAELFVNVGPPGTTPPLTLTNNNNVAYNPEFLFLVNGQDDNKDGFVDNGWDGIDNDGDGNIDQTGDTTGTGITTLSEWTEGEQLNSSLTNATPPITGFPYTIIRRPSPSPGSRETTLPSGVVVDLTGWLPSIFGAGYVSERSRLPGAVDPISGYVDIVIQPNGQVVPTTKYSNPSSFGMAATFYHFWLAERADLFDPLAQQNVPYLLPMLAGSVNYPNVNDAYPGRVLTGERRLLTLNTRTGGIVTNSVDVFDGSAPSFPFLSAQQGTTGELR